MLYIIALGILFMILSSIFPGILTFIFTLSFFSFVLVFVLVTLRFIKKL